MGLHTEVDDADGEISESENEKKAQRAKKEKKHDNVGAADLEKVTDYAEEKEISSQAIGDAMALIGGKQKKENAEKAEKEKELAKVKIKKDDVELIMNEMLVTRIQAERKLRLHRGDLVATLAELTN